MKRAFLRIGLAFLILLPDSAALAGGVLVRYRASAELPALTLSASSDVTRIETADEEVEELIETLQRDPEVEYAEPDYAIRPAALPEDPLIRDTGSFYNYEIAQIIEAWDITSDCGSVVVAVIDSGVQVGHPDLEDNIWFNGGEIPDNGADDDGNGYVDDRYGFNFHHYNSSLRDEMGHGTAVAGIIGAVGNNDVGLSGVCWSVQLLPLKIFGAKGEEGRLSAALEAIDYAIAEGARVLNLSWTLVGGEKSAFLEDALKKAEKAGVLVVTAAGNDGLDLTVEPVYPASYDLSNLIAVAAHGPDGTLLSFSNYGLGVVDLAAPGFEITTTGGKYGYTSFTGTSAAAPHVSGAAALLLSQNPSLAPSRISDLLRETVGTETDLANVVVSGGNLNVLKAISALETEEAPSGEDASTEMAPSLPAAGGCSLIGGGS
jgi:subtilisin family serine protease